MIEGLQYCIDTFGSTDCVINHLLHRPDLRQVVLSPSKKSAAVFTNFIERCTYFVTKDLSDAREFMKTIDFLSEFEPHNKKLIIGPLKDDTIPIFDDLVKSFPGVPFECRCHVYTLDADMASAMSQPTEFALKDGSRARIRSPAEEDATFINENWALGNGNAEQMLRGIIKKTPVGAIIEVDGTPACWGLQDEFGFIAFVFVIEKFRKKGLGSALIKHLSQRIIERGGCPYAYVVLGNDPSCRMFEGIGFHKLNDKYTYIGYNVLPN